MNCAAIRCPVSYAVSTFTSTSAIMPYECCISGCHVLQKELHVYLFHLQFE